MKQLQPAEAPRDAVLRRYGGGGLLPAVARHPAVPYSPLFSYKWAETEADEKQLVWTDDYSNVLGAVWRRLRDGEQ